MIYYLRGRLAEREEERIVVEVAGVGYELEAAGKLFAHVKEGDEVTVYASHVISGNRVVLFGFPSPRDRAFFELICSLPAIGPKTALRLLSELGVDEIMRAVQAGNPAVFRRVSGIGQKTASRLLVELSTRLSETVKASAPAADDALSAVETALRNLGYSRGEIEHALSAIELSEEESAEELLKKALRALSGGV